MRTKKLTKNICKDFLFINTGALYIILECVPSPFIFKALTSSFHSLNLSAETFEWFAYMSLNNFMLLQNINGPNLRKDPTFIPPPTPSVLTPRCSPKPSKETSNVCNCCVDLCVCVCVCVCVCIGMRVLFPVAQGSLSNILVQMPYKTICQMNKQNSFILTASLIISSLVFQR